MAVPSLTPVQDLAAELAAKNPAPDPASIALDPNSNLSRAQRINNFLPATPNPSDSFMGRMGQAWNTGVADLGSAAGGVGEYLGQHLEIPSLYNAS